MVKSVQLLGDSYEKVSEQAEQITAALLQKNIAAKCIVYSEGKKQQYYDALQRFEAKGVICIVIASKETLTLPVVTIAETFEETLKKIQQLPTDTIVENQPPPLPPPLLFSSIKTADKPHKPKESTMSEKFTNPYLTKQDDNWERSQAGEDLLSEWVTDTEGDVYAIKANLSPLKAAAAMARLSRRGDDMRTTLLDEFSGYDGTSEEGLIRRVVSEYGDDSVQQLVGIHLVVENASNLLTKHLEWGRLASYLEQSTRYIYFDRKDSEGKYKYYRPELPEKLLEEYERAQDTIFELYSHIVRSLVDYISQQSTETNRDVAWRNSVRAQACDAARLLLPVATKSTVGIFASAQALEGLIMRLSASDSTENQKTAEALLREARKVIPTFLERADVPEKGGATTAYVSETRRKIANKAEEILEANGYDAAPTLGPTLTSVFPNNELDLAAYMLYEFTDISEVELKQTVAEKLTYDQKVEIINEYFGTRYNRRHKPGRALERAEYSWDIMCDYGIFRDLQRHRIVNDLAWQELTPRYGYEIPKLIEEAGLSEAFEAAFDVSLALHSRLKSEGYSYEAQYATLLGHQMRWKITMNAREAFHFMELRTQPAGHPGYRRLVNKMYEQLKEVHPLIAEGMLFINQNEDPELTRLAAERAASLKRERLGLEQES